MENENMHFNIDLGLHIGEELEQELQRQMFNMERRQIRDNSNPFEIPDQLFKRLYRLPKGLAREFTDEVSPFLGEPVRITCVPNYLKILCALHFYAHGSYQKSVGQDFSLALSQTMVSRCINEVSDVIARHLSRRYIKFPRTRQEKLVIQQGFMEKFNFPGVIGCLDCTHVAIIAPPIDHPVHPGFAYLNRKGFHSINCQLICDSNLTILNCNAQYPGSMHDSAIWSMSSAFHHMEETYNNNERGLWLLGR